MLTKKQREILIGLMLGDGFLELPKTGKNASLRITRTRSDSAYIDYHVDIFSDLGAKRSDGKIKDKRTGKTYLRSSLRTRVSPILTKWHKRWYVKGRKSIPQNLIITPTTLATWFADDGSAVIKKRNYTVKLATQGFLKKEVEFLRRYLKSQYDLDFKIYKDSSGKTPHWFLMLTNKKSVRTFTNIIDPVFPIGMNRKSDMWNDNTDLLAKKIYPSCKFCDSHNIYSNGSNQHGDQKYLCKDCRRQFTTFS